MEGKSVLVSNASLKVALTSSTKALGTRVVSHARILGVDAYGAGAARLRRTQHSRLTKIKKKMTKVKSYKKYGAITSKIAMAGLMPSGLHGVRCMGLPPSRLKAFRTTVGRCLPSKHAGRSLTWRPATHECDPTHVQSRAHCGMGRGSLGRAAERFRSAQGLATAATTGWPEAVVEHGQWPDGCHHHVFEAFGMDVASPHDLRHCMWARGGLATAQGTVDSELALWREWAGNNDERKGLLPCPLLEPVILANKRAQRQPQEASATKAALDPFCLNCGPGVLGSAQHRLWACPAYRETRMDLPPTHQHQGQTATGDKLKWERGLMHDPVEKYTPGRTHDGTIHVWIDQGVVGNSFGGKLFVDGSLMCKYGSQGGQAGWAVTRRSTRLPTSRSAQRMVSCRSLSQCSGASCGQNCGHCGRPSSSRSLERRSYLIVRQCSEALNVGRNGTP